MVGLATSGGFFLLFSVLGLDNRVALSIFSGFVNLVPIVGALLGAVLPLAQCVLQFDTFGLSLVVIGSSIFLHFFVANFVMPKVVGSRINVNASSATIGLIFWGWMWGAIGLLLAIPLTALIRIFLASMPSSRKWSNLISESPMGAVTRISISNRRRNRKKTGA